MAIIKITADTKEEIEKTAKQLGLEMSDAIETGEHVVNQPFLEWLKEYIPPDPNFDPLGLARPVDKSKMTGTVKLGENAIKYR